MADWANTGIGVAVAVLAAPLVHVVRRARIVWILERETTESPARWDDSLPRRLVPPRATHERSEIA